MDFCISDDVFEALKHLLPVEGSPKGGRPTKDLRSFLGALRWKLSTGAPWRSMPSEFGPWQTVYARCKRWEKGGAMQSIADFFAELKENANALTENAKAYCAEKAALAVMAIERQESALKENARVLKESARSYCAEKAALAVMAIERQESALKENARVLKESACNYCAQKAALAAEMLEGMKDR